MLKPGQQASFSCSARDQYGQPYEAPALNWTAKGGTVTEDGVFSAGESEGLFTVQANADGSEAIAEVRITNDEKPTPPPEPGAQLIRWSGDVPPQKWMNFYTKVLSRFASSRDLKLRVSFEVPAEDDQAKAKADEAKSGLKELGLNEDQRQTYTDGYFDGLTLP